MRVDQDRHHLKMDDIVKPVPFLGLVRPLTRPRPAPRPAGSGKGPAYRPAQAGWLGGAPGLPPGPGRLARGHARPPARPRPAPRPAGSGASPASRLALAGFQAGAPGNLTARGNSTQGSFPSSPDRHHLAQVECSRKRYDLDRVFRIGNRTIKRGSQVSFSVSVIESSNICILGIIFIGSYLALIVVWYWCLSCLS